MAGARAVAPGFSPLDEELELLPGSVSPTLHNAIVRLGAAVPFRQVPPVLALLGRVTISASTVCRLTEQAGAALVAVEEATVDEIERTLPPTPAGAARQQVSVDGAMVPVLRGQWKEAKTLVVGTLAASSPSKAQALSYQSSSRGLEHFTRLATGELHRRGTFGAPLVVGVVDGALWCQSFLDHHLPHAVRVLDFPHAVEHLSQAAQAVYGPGTAPGQEWLDAHAHLLRHGQPQVVVEAVAALPVAQAVDPAAAAAVVDQVHGYLAPRLSQMAYAAFTAQGFPIGSGSVESANKLVVEARLKGAGMHWHQDHVDPLLALRCALCSDRWDALWPSLSQHRRRAAHRSRPRPVPAAPLPLPQPVRTVLPPAPRLRTIVNGKPTKDHPWRKPFLFATRPVTPPIPKI